MPLEQVPVQNQTQTQTPLVQSEPGQYRQAPPQVEEAMSKVGYVPLRSTVEGLGLRVVFNPEQQNSTIYDPRQKGHYKQIPSIVKNGVAFAKQEYIDQAVQHLQQLRAEAPTDTPAKTPADTPAQAPAPAQTPALAWPQEAAQQRPQMLQAMQPAAPLQRGWPRMRATWDTHRMQRANAIQTLIGRGR